MARGKKKKKDARPDASPSPGPFHNPFQDQAGRLKELVKKPAARPRPAPPKPAEPPDEEALFLADVADARPLEPRAGTAVRTAKAKPPPGEDEEAEVLAQLADLITGVAPLDVRDTDEYVQGARPDLNPDVLHRLALGRFPVSDHLDLHGLTVAQARERVERFLLQAFRRRQRCVLIIHGRGLSSPEGQPVLKTHLVAWLSRSGLRKLVLAFATARPYDGGAGAVYVLLRK